MTFEQGITKTVQWYLDHDAWVQAVSNPEHLEWLNKNYQQTGRNT